jgi:hypothetical protein
MAICAGARSDAWFISGPRGERLDPSSLGSRATDQCRTAPDWQVLRPAARSRRLRRQGFVVNATAGGRSALAASVPARHPRCKRRSRRSYVRCKVPLAPARSCGSTRRACPTCVTVLSSLTSASGCCSRRTSPRRLDQLRSDGRDQPRIAPPALAWIEHAHRGQRGDEMARSSTR